MLYIPIEKQKLSQQLKDKTQEFLDAGGKIIEVFSDEVRSKKENLVKKHLFFSVHHEFYSKNSGVSIARLKEIQKSPKNATKHEIETLWVYFRGRELFNND